MGNIEALDRRRFLVSTAVVGGGLSLGLTFTANEANASLDAPWGRAPSAPEFTPWLSIAPDDTITVRVATPEIGNGVMTQAAMTIAEELGCDWTKVRCEFAPPARNLAEGGVYAKAGGGLAYFSGRSTSEERLKLGLQVGASARERLKMAAAQQWGVPVTEVEAAASVLTHKPSGRTLTFGQVAARAARIKLAAEPTPKPPEEWTLLGKQSVGKINNAAIVNGTAVFGIDVRLPGMLYGALKQAPVHGGKLKSYDASKVEKMPGVVAVVAIDPDTPLPELKIPFGMANSAAQHGIAVVAEHYWQAVKALEALPVEWDSGPGGQWKTTSQIYDAARAALDKPGTKVDKQAGDISVLDSQPKIVEATYLTPYSEHAFLEPLNGTALVTADGVEVWHPSQHSENGLWVAAHEAGVAPEKVKFNQTYVGGAFGRRVFGNDLRMVVAVAKKVPGRPVHVIWSREETTRQGRYRNMIAARLKAGLDAQGRPQAFLSRSASTPGLSGAGLLNTPYAGGQIKNVRFESEMLPLHIMTGPYRGPSYNSYAFMMETFIDECAHIAGEDPLAYRLKLLEGWDDEGWAKCLKEVAAKAEWGKKLPKGMGQGVAIANWGGNGNPKTGTTVAIVALVEVSPKGAIKVHQIDLAFDTGRILNPDAVQTELVGGTIFGLNMALNEELTVKDGRIVEGNYDTYPMLRIGDVPQINVHFGALSGHNRFGEVGEPPVGPVGPAIGNAIFKATGQRIRQMPFRKLNLAWA